MATRPVPEGYHTVSPALAIDGAADAIDFYKRAFGATERYRMPSPDGKIAHAELEIGDSIVMLSDPFPQSTVRAPTALGGTSVSMFLYVEDVDAHFEQARTAGATILREPTDQEYGDRRYDCVDLEGHHWYFATAMSPAASSSEKAAEQHA